MTVYFVCRCHYDLPTCFHVKTFEADSVLEWFQQIWQPIADEEEAQRHADELLGHHVYGFDGLFIWIAEEEEKPPQTLTDARNFLNIGMDCYELLETGRTIQVLTGDHTTELDQYIPDLAFYIFDDAFAKEHPEKVSLLIREDWQLPTNWTRKRFKPIQQASNPFPSGGGIGTLWIADFFHSDTQWGPDLWDLEENRRISKCRLPDLTRVLLDPPDWIDVEDPDILAFRQATLIAPANLTPEEQGFYLAINENPWYSTNWDVYSDWLLDRGMSPGQTWLERGLQNYSELQCKLDEETQNRSFIQVDEHVAQICHHTRRLIGARHTVDCFHRRIFFDDWWAAANPDLANSILHCASRWDVLS